MQFNPDRGMDAVVKELARELPAIVAPALDVVGRENNEGHITADDIEVWCVPYGPYDVNVGDLEILIWAHQFPERIENFEERKDQIVKGVREFLKKFFSEFPRHVEGFVWILLQPTAFGKL